MQTPLGGRASSRTGQNAVLNFGGPLHPTADSRTLESAKLPHMLSVDRFRGGPCPPPAPTPAASPHCL